MHDDLPELDGPRLAPHGGGRPALLVVLCHGVGADGRDLAGLAEEIAPELPEAAFVCPDAPEPFAFAPFGRQWFPLLDLSAEALAAGVRRAAPALARFVAAEAARLGLPMERVVLGGFSQGGMTALHTGLGMASPPAAIAAFSGALPLLPSPCARIPVLLVHGEDDPIVPVALTRQTEEALQRAEVPVTALYRPGLGHGIDQAGLAALVALCRPFTRPPSA
ncbi:alpha/beta hydrolase [Elioraea thermophila]|uniref:alpha/beta hydrolase n=1 Tax=Elioraea thermophila TaxID=2185104 RepID=UPI000DF39BA2|nr:prolyl oligopeptidase family serine peptidase [Elioraea thermophila]